MSGRYDQYKGWRVISTGYTFKWQIITNDIENKRIKPGDIIPEGWYLGNKVCPIKYLIIVPNHLIIEHKHNKDNSTQIILTTDNKQLIFRSINELCIHFNLDVNIIRPKIKKLINNKQIKSTRYSIAPETLAFYEYLGSCSKVEIYYGSPGGKLPKTRKNSKGLTFSQRNQAN
jgi:hypothetical protein